MFHFASEFNIWLLSIFFFLILKLAFERGRK